MGTAGAPVSADRDQQRGGPPPERLMSQHSGDTVTRDAFFTAATAPPILLGDPARQHRTIGSEALAGHLQPELVEAAEHGQIRAREGSVRHVEVFRMGSVRTPIIGRPRPLPRQRRAAHLYTLICEEPLWAQRTRCCRRPPPPCADHVEGPNSPPAQRICVITAWDRGPQPSQRHHCTPAPETECIGPAIVETFDAR